MKLIRFLLFQFLLLCFTFNIYGQENLSLSDAITRSLENNYDVKIIRQNEIIAQTQNTWGAAGRYPTISLGLATNNRSDFNEEANAMTNTITPGVVLNWVLFDGYGIRINKEKLESYAELSSGNTAVLVEQTIQSIILAYYTVLLEKETLLVRKEVMDLSNDRYNYMLSKKDIGNAVTYDVLQAKNAWLEDKANYLLQEVIHTNAVRDLNYLMGETEDITYSFTDKFAIKDSDYLYEQLKDKMLSNNKTLRNQYINEVLAQKEIENAKSLYYPSLTLRSGVEAYTTRTKLENMNASTRNTQDVYANLSLSFNLFDGGSRKRALQIAKIQEETIQIDTDAMKHSLTNQLAQLFDIYRVRKNLYTVAVENMEAARLNMQISEDKFRAGTINSFNYRDVQLIYLNSSINRLQAIYDLIDADTALMRITGGIVTEN
ncbi:MAG: TolC family protein [Candidatus Latescibacteria bacterium]|nr:TolC family protein [Candidatus Latescibacterota bacterium]